LISKSGLAIKRKAQCLTKRQVFPSNDSGI